MVAKRFSRSSLAKALALPLAAGFSSTVAASAFQILEQSPAHLGRAFAGTASQIEDASTVYFNPAGMTELDEASITAGANAIWVRSEFNDEGSNTGDIEGETDEIGFVPNLYYVQPLNAGWAFGFGLNAPFGLASRYSDDWVGRYLATDSELQLVNVNATLAYELNEYISFGAGINYQTVDVTLESQVDSTLGINPDPSTDSSARIEGDDDAFVLDLSVHVRPIAGTQLGLLWRQGGEFSLDGDASFTRNAACQTGAGLPTGAPPAPTTGTLCAGALANLAGDVEADVEMPDTLTLSASQELTGNWSVHGDIAWTQWDTIQTIAIINSENGAEVDTLDLEYSSTVRYALGTSYKTDDVWTWRAGVAFDEAPQTDPTQVTPRIPDQDRVWLSAGFNYAVAENLSIDVGYTHLFVDDASIDNTEAQPAGVQRVVGNFDASADIIGVQANWAF